MHVIFRSFFVIMIIIITSIAQGSASVSVPPAAQLPHQYIYTIPSFTYGLDLKPVSVTLTIETPGLTSIAKTIDKCTSFQTLGIITLGLALCYYGYKRLEKDKPWEGWPLMGLGATLVCAATWITAQMKQLPTWG